MKGNYKMDNCQHLSVTIHSRLHCINMLTKQIEYEYKARCDECGAWMDTLDIPEEAVEHDA